MLEIKATNPVDDPAMKVRIFMAGSIEMGVAEDWQNKFKNAMIDLDVVLLNPRRDKWDSSLPQDKNNPDFREQVEWEQHCIHKIANIIIFYFDPNTKSPITLMELGQVVHDPVGVLVCCPTGFWRKGNVDIVCEAAGIPVFESLDELIQATKEQIQLAQYSMDFLFGCEDE